MENNPTISIDKLLHPDKEALQRRDKFIKSFTDNYTIIRMNDEVIINENS